ncbi:hypothetical protein NKH10_23080 [Mesorhizobium sp. M1340]|uniref:hypothetical protein n=1 Tax=unclassified Mesorhizobium TaxID=325217 RepID=UPI003336BED2
MHLDLIDYLGEDIDRLEINGEVELPSAVSNIRTPTLVSSSLIMPIPMPVGI